MLISRFASTALVALTAACANPEGGQVAASVNGEEVTFQEINAELRSMQIPAETSENDAQKLALERIVDRRLMAQAARREGLDRTPVFLLRERQLRDALLAQLLREQTQASVSPTDPKALDRFVSDNASLFSGRQLLTLEQISFDLPDDVRQLKTIEDATSLDGVARQLRVLDLPFERGARQLDSYS